MDTATYFTSGYLSQGNYRSAPAENRGHIITMPDSVNYTFADSLTPSTGCPAYSSGDTSSKAKTFRGTYQRAIASRLNKYLNGLTLNATVIGVMQDLCGFQAEVSGDTRFCDIFTGGRTPPYSLRYHDDLVSLQSQSGLTTNTLMTSTTTMGKWCSLAPCATLFSHTKLFSLFKFRTWESILRNDWLSLG